MEETMKKEAPQLTALLKEMKEGLDAVRSKVEVLTAKVKANQYVTGDGISYLEAKPLLLLNYCQSLVYYLLRKAKGFSIDGHPVVSNLVEIRLFLEKIRPIDKKLQYQIEKLMRAPTNVTENAGPNDKEANVSQKAEDLLKYHPHPDMLNPKTENEDNLSVYKIPKFAPVAMEEDKMTKREKNAARIEEKTLRDAKGSEYIRELLHVQEGKPEEIRDMIGAESRELTKYISKREELSRQEEERFTRRPLTKDEKKKQKRLKMGDGLHGLTENFFDDIKAIPFDVEDGDHRRDFTGGNSRGRKFKKQKRKH